MPVPTVALAPGLTVSAQGYGAMSVSPAYGPVDLDEALATLHRAVDLGITFVDTADVYGDGTSERVVGKLLKDRGDEVQVATKFGLVGALGTGNRGIDGRPEYAKRAIDESLSRLGVDSVDLYYLHRVDPTVPIEDTVGALAELVQAGKIRHIGLSEATGDELRRAHAVHPIAAIQSEWSIVSRDVEKNVVPTAAELGIGFVPYSPVSRGLLTDDFDAGQIGDRDLRRRFPPVRRRGAARQPAGARRGARGRGRGGGDRRPGGAGVARRQGAAVRVAVDRDPGQPLRRARHRERRGTRRAAHRRAARPARRPRRHRRGRAGRGPDLGVVGPGVTTGG